LIDPLTASISLRNTSTNILPVELPTTDYHRPPLRRTARHLAPGQQRYRRRHKRPARVRARHYVVRVTMLGAKLDSVLDRPIGGTVVLESGSARLKDETGHDSRKDIRAQKRIDAILGAYSSKSTLRAKFFAK
jgi:hypothetical protein